MKQPETYVAARYPAPNLIRDAGVPFVRHWRVAKPAESALSTRNCIS
jgi:hypothetical protein